MEKKGVEKNIKCFFSNYELNCLRVYLHVLACVYVKSDILFQEQNKKEEKKKID